ncbi:uncharacterized protein GBIM_09919 [Gryllus bimaculatus]|nr:uncharacterized protein GBIM_09919 [Gryllus bimaculatus]
MGYDISDFKNINDIFGTLGDFDEMLQEAHRLGLKVILDFVPNHSSDEHEWFQRAVREGKNSDYYNYYIWHEGQNDGEDPPNNWGGAFTQEEPGSAWSKYKNPITGAETEWYLHQFHQKQPDLNYRHPALVQAMKDVLSFWVRRGVDGFRVDAINHLVEDEEFRDNTGSDRDMQVNQPLTYEIVKQWRDVLDREGALLQKDLTLMLEVYADPEPLMKYFGSELRPAGDFPFNFFVISQLNLENLSAAKLQEVLKLWLDNKPDFGWSNWVVGNHDQHRVGTRLGSDLIDAYNMLVTLLPGTAITYNGEEIGMLNNEDLKVADCQDPQACPDDHKEDEDYYSSKTRDYERTPIQWDKTENAGFTTGTPWLPVNKNYDTLNVAAQEGQPDSHLNVYKKLAALRNELAIQRGDFHMETIGSNVFSFSRVADEEEVSRESFVLPARASVVLTSEPKRK